MPVTIEQIREFLDDYDLQYQVDEEREAILIGFELDPAWTSYRDQSGEPTMRLVIRAMEEGEFLSIFVPQAWGVADCQHKAAVFEAIASIQAQYKMLRFDYDPTDGEIRPNMEIPLEDGGITCRQFHRVMHGLYLGVQRFDGVIRHAMATGEVSFASVPAEELAEESIEEPSPTLPRLHQLAEQAGGIEALERIACGCEFPEPSTASAASAAPADAAPLKPVIRLIWEQLFGENAFQNQLAALFWFFRCRLSPSATTRCDSAAHRCSTT
jgi:hypothetical protein